MTKPNVVYVTYIKTTPEKLWHALTDPAVTARYWGHRNVSDWRVGSPWRHEDSDNGTVHVVGKVIESDPPRRLVTSWAIPADAENPAKQSIVAFDIDALNEIVRLTVTHSDLEPNALRDATMGWAAVLSSLKTLLETGRGLPMAENHWGH